MTKHFKRLISLSSVSVVLLLLITVFNFVGLGSWAHIKSLGYIYIILWFVIIFYALILSIKSMNNSLKPGYVPDYELAYKAKCKLIGFFIVHYILWVIGVSFKNAIFDMRIESFYNLVAFYYSVIKGTFFIMFATSADLIVPTIKAVRRKQSNDVARDRILPLVATAFLLCFILDVVGANLLMKWNKENRA